ncbi:hypothetical protein EDD11_001793 [Mortierella claussenii]|nr:hypothetical protein EDD11_001793 [Mortierella claussenii]
MKFTSASILFVAMLATVSAHNKHKSSTSLVPSGSVTIDPITTTESSATTTSPASTTVTTTTTQVPTITVPINATVTVTVTLPAQPTSTTGAPSSGNVLNVPAQALLAIGGGVFALIQLL